jgi:Ca2+-transporting ATPase
MAFFTLSLSQLVHAFNNRYELKSVIANGMFKNKYLNIAVLISLFIQIMVLSTSFLRKIFKVTLLNSEQIVIVLLCSIAPLVVVEIAKLFRKK